MAIPGLRPAVLLPTGRKPSAGHPLRSRPPSPSSSGSAAPRCRTARLWPGSSSRDPRPPRSPTLLERAQSARTTLTREQAQRRLAEAWARILTIDTDPISVGDVAVALQSLTAIPVRDGIIALLVPDTLDRDEFPDDVRALLREITTRLDG